MHTARILFSRQGELKATIDAFSIGSREHYRNLWPLVTPDDPPRRVSWVSGVFEGDECKRRSHFRLCTRSTRLNPRKLFEDEETERQRFGESPHHKLAKELIAAELQRRIAAGLALPWAYAHESAGGFAMGGDLLLGADSVVVEHPITTPPPLSKQYRLDVAVLGKPVLRNPVVLAGIEIEFEHAFDGRKAMAGRCSGFPLISIDITDMSMEELTPAWAHRVLTDTSRSATDGHRKTFVYLNPLLYPLYALIPHEIAHSAARHQFIAFASDEQLNRILSAVRSARDALGLSDKEVVLQIVNSKSPQARTRLENLGAIAGVDWADFNPDKCLLISLDRPKSLRDLQRHLMHNFLAMYLAGWGDALVAYRWRDGILNHWPNEDLWIESIRGVKYTALPKRLAMPFSRYLKALEMIDGHARPAE